MQESIAAEGTQKFNFPPASFLLSFRSARGPQPALLAGVKSSEEICFSALSG